MQSATDLKEWDVTEACDVIELASVIVIDADGERALDGEPVGVSETAVGLEFVDTLERADVTAEESDMPGIDGPAGDEVAVSKRLSELASVVLESEPTEPAEPELIVSELAADKGEPAEPPAD